MSGPPFYLIVHTPRPHKIIIFNYLIVILLYVMYVAVLNYEEDVGKYTVKVATDPRTCNRVVIYRPKTNIISQLQLISLWEKKTGQTFKRVHLPEQQIIDLSECKYQYHDDIYI